MYTWLHRIWYEGGSLYWVLLPLSGLYWLVITVRKSLYRLGLFGTYRAPVPIIVVGNITAGGTGKTPVTIWLTRYLVEQGFKPGIVSRGYGGSRSLSSLRVDAESDPSVVGDEPVLVAQRTRCPVVVDADRASGVKLLVEDGVDVVVADDGLQHYRLERDYEICVIDGARGLGNRLLLPAGPMRETVGRLSAVDQVLVNGVRREHSENLAPVEQDAIEFELVATEVRRLDGSAARPIDAFAGETVHAVAAIGNPGRFFDMLRAHGMQVIEHAYRDHAPLGKSDLEFGDDRRVLMTEKDAVKVVSGLDDRYWAVPVDLSMDPVVSGPWLEHIESCLRNSLEQQ
jgi:tetraacyldisaccharide 4'-kinase